MPTKEQVKYLEAQFGALVVEQPVWKQFREILLGWGGKLVCAQYEEDMGKLLSCGVGIKWRPRHDKVQLGEPSRCHANAARLWEDDPDNISIMTGWALSKDGIWRQHTWVITCEMPPKTGRIIETTEKRLVYFGYRMTKKEAERFAEENLW